MIAKWFLFLNKIVSALKSRGLELFEENVSIMDSKKIWSVLGISLVAPFCVFLYFLFLFQQESLLNKKMQGLEKKVKSLVVFKKEQDRFLREFGACDPAFLKKYVERMQLLKDEADFLSKISDVEGYEPLQRRLSFLTNGENSIEFVLKAERKSNVYREEEWTLKKSVEVQNEDVLQIISLLEGVKLSNFSPNPLRPQFIIKKFSLNAKEGNQEKGFYLDLEILQRSFCEKI